MRAAFALPVLVACATAPAPVPEQASVFIGPSMTQQQCDLSRLENRRFEVDMKAVALEKALRGIADCTCLHFELKPGAAADITIPPQPQPLKADDLLAEFQMAAEARGIKLTRQSPPDAWPAKYMVERR